MLRAPKATVPGCAAFAWWFPRARFGNLLCASVKCNMQLKRAAATSFHVRGTEAGLAETRCVLCACGKSSLSLLCSSSWHLLPLLASNVFQAGSVCGPSCSPSTCLCF